LDTVTLPFVVVAEMAALVPVTASGSQTQNELSRSFGNGRVQGFNN
jgi:hypothetical protein